MNFFDIHNQVDSDQPQSTEFSDCSKDKLSSYGDSHELGLLESMACACLLDEAANKLSILRSIGDLPPVRLEPYQTLKERFTISKPDANVFDPETIEPYHIAVEKQKFIKFQKDIVFADSALRSTVVSLVSSNNYDPLIKVLREFDQTFFEENELLETEIKNRTKLENLRDLMDSERRELEANIQNQAKLLANLKDLKEDTIFDNLIKKNYIEHWENSRIEQNVVRLDRQEDYYLNIINESKANIDKETRISAEIVAYINEIKTEYEDSIQMWMEKYDREVELRDTEIQILKEKREEQFNRLHELSKLYDKHKLEIEEYLEVKEQRRLKAEHQEKLEKAAIKIQAWWRGLMVRKGFGPFSKKKKGKDAAKPKKGKK